MKGPLALAALIAALASVAGAGAAPQATVERIVLVTPAGELVAAAPNGARERLTATSARETEPAVSPDGLRVAFVREGAIHLLNLRTRRVARVGPGTSPAWSRDGRLAAVVDGAVVVGGQAVAAGGEPAFAPDGTLAYVRDGTILVGEAPLVPGSGPAFSPDGARLAFADEAGVAVLDLATREIVRLGPGIEPAWSPDGARIAAATAGGVRMYSLADGTSTALPGTQSGDSSPAWALVETPPAPKPGPDRNELLPDLDQRAPSGLSISVAGGRYLLGFASATDNVGRGPLWIRASRPNTRATSMQASQLIRLTNGRIRVVRNVGLLRFVNDPPHYHWHFMRFQSFELRRAADFRLLVRDRKTGFCFADHYGLARHRVENFTGARFFGNCGQHQRGLRSVEMGTSVGFTDRYPAHFHGQNVDITRVPAGVYVLVHRANHRNLIRELRYDNNAASLRIRIDRPGGVPRVRILRRCESSERC